VAKLRIARKCQEAAEKGLAWILGAGKGSGVFCPPETGPKGASRREASGRKSSPPAFPRLVACHKVPYLLARAGRGPETAACLDWLRDHVRQDDGSFGDPAAWDGVDEAEDRHAYMNAWLAQGAHLAGRFELSYPTAAYLASCQGRSVGGVYNAHDGERAGTHDAGTAACAGLAFLSCGMLDRARKAGQFLVDALRAQPQPGRFCLRFDCHGRAVATPPPGREAAYVVAAGEAHQHYDCLQIAAVFLARLSVIEDDPEFLAAAKEYARFLDACAPQALSVSPTGLPGWAAAVLYRITRRRAYYEVAERAAARLIEEQHESGLWFDGLEYDTPAAQPRTGLLDMTATMTVLLHEFLCEVA